VSTEVPLGGLIIAATLVFSAINPVFFSVENAQTIFRAVAFVGIIAVGMTFLLISGKFDLSVGSVAALGAVSAGQFMNLGVPTWIAVAGGLIVAAAIGAVNAFLTLWLHIPVLIVTLGTLYIARGLALVITNGLAVRGLTDEFKEFGQAEFAGLPISVWIFLTLTIAAFVVLKYTPFGRYLYASGGNDEAARLAGVKVRSIRAAAFVLVSTLSGLAGILIMGRIESGQPTIGQGYELSVLAACVVGGVSLFGGRGTISGMFLGVIFVQIVSVGLVLSRVDPTLQQVGIGLALLIAVVVDVVRSQRGLGR
jgi:ribose/xylose/arabinose/galactoside ABC-type transport system permease subunit